MSTNTRAWAILAAVCMLAASTVPAFAAAPGNDDFADRTVVSAIPYTDNQDTSEATTETTDPSCAGQGPTVWYEHTPAADVRLEANTFGSSYDTTLLVAIDDGDGHLEVIRCNDDAGDDLQSRVRINAEAGVTYFFMVGAYGSGPRGQLTFNLLEGPEQELSVTLSLDPTGKFRRDGSAVLTGVVTCSGTEYVELDGGLTQRVGRITIRGWGYDFVECSSEGTPFELQIGGDNGKFAGGQAQAFVGAYACGDEDCAYDFVEASIRLRK